MASVLITGTSKGIGLETALAFGRAGYKVHATMRNPERSPLLAETAAKEHLPITISAMDVDSDDSVRGAIAKIQGEHGLIDVLVNNAGVEVAGAIEEISLAQFRTVMETNYFGCLRCIQALVPHMRQRRHGRIINVSSVAGRIATPPVAPYVASKWALEALSEVLACEMKPFGVRVAIVEPGIIDTAMARRLGDKGEESVYPQRARFTAMFSAALQNPVPPTLVAEKIVAVAQSESWQLRYLVGPDAEPFIAWRQQFSDEQWVDLNAGDEETWNRTLQRDFGLVLAKEES
jgi:NAD(P)-dependent dehydrogenase (short-subunit alcohol dehydrogenase family)